MVIFLWQVKTVCNMAYDQLDMQALDPGTAFSQAIGVETRFKFFCSRPYLPNDILIAKRVMLIANSIPSCIKQSDSVMIFFPR